MTAPRSADLVVGGILLPVVGLVSILACGGLASGEPTAMAFGAVFAASAAGIGWGAISQLRSGLAAMRAESASRLTRQRETAAGTLGHTRARWEVDAATWGRFWAVERRDRLAEAFGMWLGVTVLGGGLLALSRGLPLTGAVGFAAVFGLGIAALWHQWVTRGRWATARVVDVSDTTLYLGRIAHVFRSDRHRLEGARILRDRDPPALELSVSWPTRNGRQTEEVRAPVPAERLEAAEALVAELKSGSA